MDITRFKRVLMMYSAEELKTLLGNSLAEMLIEWTPTDQSLFKKATLADMIATIHGVTILKDKPFRYSFLVKMGRNDILSFRGVMPRKYLTSTNLNEIVGYVASRSWRKDSVIDHMLSLLGITEDIFKQETIDEDAVTNISSPERFFELLDYQFVIKQRILNELTSDTPLVKMLVQMPTGTGKTKTAMHTIVHHFNFNLEKQGLVIWLAHTTELLYQAYETFISVWQHLGKGDVKTYKLWGKFNIPEDGETLSGFMFCGLQKLMSIAASKPQLFDRLIADCRLVVIDEAHKAAAPETKRLINGLMTRKQDMSDRSLIGLTATPGRNVSDSQDIERLVSMFEGRIIGIDPKIINSINLSRIKALNAKSETDIIRYFQSRRILAKIHREPITYPESLSDQELRKLRIQATENGYDDYSREFLELIGRKKSRNLSILTKLIQLNDDKVPTIVFACSVEHGSLLSAALTLQGINNACVFGNMDPVMRRQAIRRFKDREDGLNILINFEVLTTGFDATNIKCVFITRPTQSVVLYSQMIGRGLRGPLMGGNEACLLVDIEDNLKKYDESSAFRYFENYWSYEIKGEQNQEGI